MTLVTVRYFAAAAEAAGVDEERLELTDGATLGALRDELVARYGAPMQRVLRSGRGESWARTAADHGYFDEAHMANDVRELAGATPHALLG